MSKTSKVTKLEPWDNAKPDDYGNLMYNIEFENGDSGAYRGNPNKLSFAVGRESEYEINEVTSKNGKKYTKVSKPQQQGSGFSRGGGRYSDVGVTVGNALNNASLLAAHGKIDVKDMPKVAERIIETAIELKNKYKDQF